MFNMGVANIDVIFSKYIFKGLYKIDSRSSVKSLFVISSWSRIDVVDDDSVD